MRTDIIAYQLFLTALKYGLAGKRCDWDFEIDTRTWKSLLNLATGHSALPLIGNAVYSCPSVELLEEDARKSFINECRRIVIRQAKKTAEFLRFYEYLTGLGFQPLVIKGIICRDLYPSPELRPSADEDLLISADMFPQYHRACIDYGLSLVDPSIDIETADEISYQDPDRYLYIELHKSLFPENSEAYGNLNQLFTDLITDPLTGSCSKDIYGITIKTLEPTEHLLYLILHSLKHFLHSGFGIRQICDIILFSIHYKEKIKWTNLFSRLNDCHAYDFSCAVYKIGYKYLLESDSIPEYLPVAHIRQVDEKPLLKDILEGGLYGASSVTRLHSSYITLQAVTSHNRRLNHIYQKQSSERKVRILPRLIMIGRVLFLPRSSMEGRFPYLRKWPFLLPLAWSQRMVGYILEGRTKTLVSDAADSIRLGKERIKLLEKYHII